MTKTNFIDYKKECHYGNTPLYKMPDGGTLYIGGWNQGAHFNWNTHVIDLTGNERKLWDMPTAYDDVSQQFLAFTGQLYAGWLSLPFPDYKTPATITTKAQWEGMASIVKGILASGKDVLVACHGGHGRSGLFCAIVCYILAVNTDRSWSSPVEKIRKIHCVDAVETFAQEKFVYDVLDLDIQIKHTYTKEIPSTWKYESCPICNVQSTFVHDIGMCLGCQKKYTDIAPEKIDFVAADLKTKGEVDHACSHASCIGIWKAPECGHVVHDKIIIDGYCETCNKQLIEEEKFAQKADKESQFDPCAICQRETWYSDRFGVCYECGMAIEKAGQADWVHNSITDPYVAVPHHCLDDFCIGIVVADVCGHVVHNREIEDGNCPECTKNNKKELEDT